MSAEHFGLRKEAEEYPLMVHVLASYVCNSKCKNCPFTETNTNIRKRYREMGAEFIPSEIFKMVADECGKFKSFMRITGGGEPLIHPDLIDLIIYAKSAGAGVGIITNGSLLFPEKSDKLLAANADAIEISVDAADKETYSKIRRGLDWDVLMSNIKHLVEKRNKLQAKTKVIVSVVNQKIVADKIKEIENFWNQLVDYVIIRKFLSWGVVNKRGSGDPSPYISKNTPCPYPFERIVVDSTGDILLCGYDIEGKTSFGNMRNETIQSVWKGEKLNWWREKMLKGEYDEIPMCKYCQDRQYRSWDYNYLRSLKQAENGRKKKIRGYGKN